MKSHADSPLLSNSVEPKYDFSEAVTANLALALYIILTLASYALTLTWASLMPVSHLEAICVGYIGNFFIFAAIQVMELSQTKSCSRLKLIPTVGFAFLAVVFEAIVWLYNRWAVAFHIVKMADWFFVVGGFVLCRIGLFREKSLSPTAVIGTSAGLFMVWYYPGLFTAFVGAFYGYVLLSFLTQALRLGVVVSQRQLHKACYIPVPDIILKVSQPMSLLTLGLVAIETIVLGRKFVFLRILATGPKAVAAVFGLVACNAGKVFADTYLNVKCRLETYLVIFGNHQLLLWFGISLVSHEVQLTFYGWIGALVIVCSQLWYIRQYMTEEDSGLP